jgi:V/A-type H+-transporting ATPase subunit A
VLAVAERCQELATAGVPPAVLEDQDFSPILRAREEASALDGVRARQEEVLAALARAGGEGARETDGAT